MNKGLEGVEVGKEERKEEGERVKTEHAGSTSLSFLLALLWSVCFIYIIRNRIFGNMSLVRFCL